MTKIVKNCCYGGFGLSLDAEIEYLKLIGKKAYFYMCKNFKYIKISKEKAKKLDRIYYILTKNIGNIVSEKKMNNSVIDKIYFNSRDIPRDDKNLVKVVEKLGDKANGIYAELRVVEIPDDIKWKITEYDGIETVREQHQEW